LFNVVRVTVHRIPMLDDEVQTQTRESIPDHHKNMRQNPNRGKAYTKDLICVVVTLWEIVIPMVILQQTSALILEFFVIPPPPRSNGVPYFKG